MGDLVRGIPLLKFVKDNLCATCEMGKQSKKNHSSILNTNIIEQLELIHINLGGPSSIKSIGGNKYISSIVRLFKIFLGMFFLDRNLKLHKS